MIGEIPHDPPAADPDRRRPLRYFAFFAFLLALGFIAAACNDSPADPVTVDSIEVQGPDLMAPGDTAQASASVFDAAGNVLANHPVQWSSSDEGVAEVTTTGLITAGDIGNVMITATADGVSDSFIVTVQDDPCATPVGAIEIGDTVEGELTEESCFLDSWFHDPWLMELEEEVTVRIDLESTDFDAFVLLTDGTGVLLADDDDSGEGDNARLEITLPAATYFVWASTFVEMETGSYTLTVTEITIGGAPTGQVAPRDAARLTRAPALAAPAERRKR